MLGGYKAFIIVVVVVDEIMDRCIRYQLIIASRERKHRHRTDERNSREKHRLWISRAYRETQTLNP